MVEALMLDYGNVSSKDVAPKQRIVISLSAATTLGSYLWTGSDETKTLEVLKWTTHGYGEARSISLADYFPLPDKKPEIDIEGIHLDGKWLWIVGSHSVNRPNLYSEPDEPEPDRLRAFETGSIRANNCLLGCLELSPDGRDIVTPKGQGLCLPFTGKDDLRSELAESPHIAPFLPLASKENGLDIEGIAAKGDRVLLGLRGPVLRGSVALIVELRIAAGSGRLQLQRMPDDKARHWVHFLPLGGAGIRDLQAMDKDLMIWTGPTMGVHGPFAARLWRGGMARGKGGIVGAHELADGPVVPSRGDGQPEALSMIALPDGRKGWLVLHDAPDATRYLANGLYRADFIPA